MTGTEVVAWVGVVLGGGGLASGLVVLVRAGMFIQRQKTSLDDIAKLQAAVANLNDNLDAAKKELADTSTSEMDDLDKQTRNEVRRIFEKIEGVAKELGGVQNELGILKASMGDKLRNLTTAEERLTDLIAQLRSISSRQDTMSRDSERMEARQTDSGQKISALEARVKNLEDRDNNSGGYARVTPVPTPVPPQGGN